MWQEAREEIFLLRHPPFQVLPAMLRYCPQCATPFRFDRQVKKKDPAGVGQVPDIAWWPLPELNWGHEDFQS